MTFNDASLNSMENPLSPLALHPQDNLDIAIVLEPLDVTNFVSWSHAVKCTLSVKNKARRSHFCFHITSSDKDSWILDTGATNHMTCDLVMFSTVPEPSNVKIKLHNNAITTLTLTGNVILNEFLTLHNVLYVLEFNFNLLTISHLTNNSNCTVSFLSSHCVLQDNTTKKVIDIVEQYGGLYCIKSIPVSFANTVHSFDHVLWHSRLGHISGKRLLQIPHLSHISKHLNKELNNIACDICPLAKQKKASFPVSNSISYSIFDLIHCDVWCLFSISSLHGNKYFLTIVENLSRCA